MDCTFKIVAIFALVCGSLEAHANAGPEQETMAAPTYEVNGHSLGTSLLPTEVTITQKHHQTRTSGEQSAPHQKITSQAKLENSKSKEAFLSITSSKDRADHHATPSSFLASASSSSAHASSGSSSSSSAYASLMTDRSLEPLESLELDSNLEGLVQHLHDEDGEDSEQEGYHIAPEDAPRFPGSVLETDRESEEKDERDDKGDESDQDDYEGLGLSASESRSMRDTFRNAAHSTHRKSAKRAPSNNENNPSSSSLLEDIDLPHRERSRLSSSLLEDEDLQVPHHAKARKKPQVAPWDEDATNADSDGEGGHHRLLHEVAKTEDDEMSRTEEEDDEDEEEMLKRDSGDDLTDDATHSLKSLRKALEGSSVTELNGNYPAARPKHAKAKHSGATRFADSDGAW